MTDLSDIEKKLALLVIREMEKNHRSLKDLEHGADAVLKVFRKVTTRPMPNPVKRKLMRLLLPFGSHANAANPDRTTSLLMDQPPTAGTEGQGGFASALDRPTEGIVEGRNGKQARIVYTWSETPPNRIMKIRVIVESETASKFDTIAGGGMGPFESVESANEAGLQIADSWFNTYDT